MIKWPFIEDLEGVAITVGYVPLGQSGHPLGKSGVTIASGVDLGQRSVAAWQRLGIHDLTLELIEPYCGAKGDAALRLLDARPLELSEAHVRELDNCLRDEFLRSLSARWGRDSADDWDGLDDRQQTVVMSVAWQYGRPWDHCPTFWGCATSGDWAGVVAELRNFGDAYPTRRGKEADYLEALR